MTDAHSETYVPTQAHSRTHPAPGLVQNAAKTCDYTGGDCCRDLRARVHSLPAVTEQNVQLRDEKRTNYKVGNPVLIQIYVPRTR